MRGDLSFFDSNCMIGRRMKYNPGEISRVDELLSDMDYYGIDEALVYHAVAREYYPSVGNGILMEEIGAADRLHPCWVVMPDVTGEMDKPDVLVSKMMEMGVRCARIFPEEHKFSLKSWACGGLLRELERGSIPTFIGRDQISWDQVHELCLEYPDLPVIITSVNYREDRYLYPLLERFRNLYFEISWYGVHLGIESICERFGPERILFGTGLPSFTPGPALTSVMYAQIDEDSRRMIAGDNLRRLLRGVKG